MSISAISSTAGFARIGTEIQWQQEMHDYQALNAAMQSGNLASILKAFSAWQQDLHAANASNSQSSQQVQPFGSNAQANTAFQAVSKTLQSGDVASAQTAFATLQKELQAGGSLRNRANNGNTAFAKNHTLGAGAAGSTLGSPPPALSSPPTGSTSSSSSAPVSTSTSPSPSTSTAAPASTTTTSVGASALDTLS